MRRFLLGGGSLGCPIGFEECFQHFGNVMNNFGWELGHVTSCNYLSSVVHGGFLWFEESDNNFLLGGSTFEHDIREHIFANDHNIGWMLLLGKFYKFYTFSLYEEWWVFN